MPVCPLGKELVVMLSGSGLIFIVIATDPTFGGCAESVAVNVADMPFVGVDGVPEIEPVGASDNPAGSVPTVMAHVCGKMPPSAWSEAA